jgi:hypothetical protein
MISLLLNRRWIEYVSCVHDFPKETTLVLAVPNQYRFNAEVNRAPKCEQFGVFIQIVAVQRLYDNSHINI